MLAISYYTHISMYIYTTYIYSVATLRAYYRAYFRIVAFVNNSSPVTYDKNPGIRPSNVRENNNSGSSN